MVYNDKNIVVSIGNMLAQFRLLTLPKTIHHQCHVIRNCVIFYCKITPTDLTRLVIFLQLETFISEVNFNKNDCTTKSASFLFEELKKLNVTAQTKDQILETLEKMSGLLAGTSKTQVMFPCFLFAPFVFFVFVFVFFYLEITSAQPIFFNSIAYPTVKCIFEVINKCAE